MVNGLRLRDEISLFRDRASARLPTCAEFVPGKTLGPKKQRSVNSHGGACLPEDQGGGDSSSGAAGLDGSRFDFAGDGLPRETSFVGVRVYKSASSISSASSVVASASAGDAWVLLSGGGVRRCTMTPSLSGFGKDGRISQSPMSHKGVSTGSERRLATPSSLLPHTSSGVQIMTVPAGPWPPSDV